MKASPINGIIHFVSFANGEEAKTTTTTTTITETFVSQTEKMAPPAVGSVASTGDARAAPR